MAIFHRIKDYLSKSFIITKDIKTKRILLTAIIFTLIYSLLAVMVVPSRVIVDLGKPSTRTVFAPHDAVDEHTTNLRREEAAQDVQEVYTHDPEVLEEALIKIDYFFDKIFTLKEDSEKSRSEKTEVLQELLESEVSEAIIIDVLETNNATLADIRGRLKAILVNVIEEQGIKAGGLETAKSQIMQEISGLIFSFELKKVAEKIVEPLIRPNMIYNPAATAEKQEAAREEVEPVIIPSGARIISEGEIVTNDHINRLESLGLIRGGHTDYSRFIGLFLLLLVIFFTVGLYLFIFYKDVYNNPSLLVLLGLVVVITLIFTLAVNYFSHYLIPVSAAVILITVLFGHRLAILLNIVIAIMVGLITGGDFGIIIMSLISGLVAILTVSRLSRRADLVKAGLYVSAVNVAIIVTVFLLQSNIRLEYTFLREFGFSLFAGMGNGFFSAVVAIGLLPFLESGFGLTTSVTLLELSNPNQPLLRKLMMKAPGTYHHSIIVGNLAEAAAEEVEADPLLARVAALYHDIGKISRPYFFSENQFTGENPHQKLSPSLSTLIVSAHVKDGAQMARHENLPVIIQDIIKQHHGTSMISYFYQQALENDRHDIMEENFRYEGPLPQTKEVGIIMLADIVEAGVRSLSKPTSDRVAAMVRKMIKDKLNDGQLDECDLTMRDIDKICEKFIYIISGIYHNRIEYPESELKAQIERSSS